jgi:CysZ protein
VKQLLKGFLYAPAALRYISARGLWRLAGFAIGVNALLFVVLAVGSIVVVWPWINALEAWLAGMSEQQWLSSFLAAMAWVVRVVAVPLLLFLNGYLLVVIGQAVASPFLDALSERVEQLETGVEPAAFRLGAAVRALGVAIVDLGWMLGLLLCVNVPIFILGLLLPVVGTAVAAVLSFCFSALLLANEFGTLVMARQMRDFRARWRLTWQHRWLFLGFGSAVMGMLMVPILNLLLLPLAAVGGTLMYCELRQ